MKHLIFFLIIMSLPLFAQDKKDNDKTALEIKTKEWMTKISSDPELRLSMMAMILDETNGNKEEMTSLGKKIMDNPGMNSIIAGMLPGKANSDNMKIPSRTMMGDSSNTRTMKMSGHESYQKK
ncbi:MAG: hypothetical protein WCE54_02720 [Ignavibacteriaceae bacterium]